MLQSIDTLIAFVLIVTVASMFVTILVQIFSALLSLRGKNLANALSVAFQTIAPSLKDEAHQLSAKILSDPLLSDSTRTLKNKISGIVSTVAQRAAPWHFRNIRGATHLASAVRPEEVYGALVRLSEQNDVGAKKILGALFIPKDEEETIHKQLALFRAIADDIPDEETRRKLLAAVEETPANFLVKADAARAKFDLWFVAAEDRAQQWFRLHTRGLAIAASFLIAFLFQLDAVEIFHRVSTSAATRNALVAASPTFVQQTSPDQKANSLGDLERRISATGFDFVPVDFWRWPTQLPEAPRSSPFWYYVWSYWRHSLGMTIFAALLTLGAPYWYNLLKNLTSLRPALAQAIGKEEAKTPNE